MEAIPVEAVWALLTLSVVLHLLLVSKRRHESLIVGPVTPPDPPDPVVTVPLWVVPEWSPRKPLNWRDEPWSRGWLR